MDKKINNNGHDYVDLELPSHTLWATMNVGASKPSEFGLYFQWGDTKGYSEEQIGTGGGQKKFFWTDYKWNPSGDGDTFTKYTNPGDTLELEDDAAHVHMEGDWHIPTPTQIQELLDNTISSWTTSDDGINGMIFISKKDTSKSIFIPAAGIAWNGCVAFSYSDGNVWSSMLDHCFENSSENLCFYQNHVYIDYYNRSDGFPVRGVIG